MTVEDLAALQARVAELEARLAPAAPPLLPALEPVATEPRITVHISTLVGGPELGCLHRDVREVRRLVHALALAYDVPAPSQHIPKLWLSPLRRLAALRAAGLTWRAAISKEGLEIPDDLDNRARALRTELDHLWDDLQPTVALSLATVNSISQGRLREKLEKLWG